MTLPRKERPDKNDLLALARFESEVGGRDALVEHLQHGALSAEQEYIIGAIADPANSNKSLAAIAGMLRIPVGQIIKLFMDAGFTKAQLQAFEKVWKRLPEVAEDVMGKAVRRKIDCPVCKATGELEYEVKPDGWKKGDPLSSEIKPCWNCQGEKQVWVEPDLETQKIALEMGGILKKGGVQVGVQVNTQQNLSGGGGLAVITAGQLEDFRAATDRVLFPSRRGKTAEPVEAEVVGEEEEEEESE